MNAPAGTTAVLRTEAAVEEASAEVQAAASSRADASPLKSAKADCVPSLPRLQSLHRCIRGGPGIAEAMNASAETTAVLRTESAAAMEASSRADARPLKSA